MQVAFPDIQTTYHSSYLSTVRANRLTEAQADGQIIHPRQLGRDGHPDKSRPGPSSPANNAGFATAIAAKEEVQDATGKLPSKDNYESIYK